MRDTASTSSTGQMHLVFRLSGEPLRLFDHDQDREGRVISTMLVGGARSGFYTRDVTAPLCSVGALLRPGAAEVLFGVTLTSCRKPIRRWRTSGEQAPVHARRAR